MRLVGGGGGAAPLNFSNSHFWAKPLDFRVSNGHNIRARDFIKKKNPPKKKKNYPVRL